MFFNLQIVLLFLHDMYRYVTSDWSIINHLLLTCIFGISPCIKTSCILIVVPHLLRIPINTLTLTPNIKGCSSKKLFKLGDHRRKIRFTSKKNEVNNKLGDLLSNLGDRLISTQKIFFKFCIK